MKKATVTLKGITPYSPSRHYLAEFPKLKDESPDQYDERTWRNHAHVKGGHIIIPGDCFAWALKAMSKRRSDKIQGKRGQTFTKVFDASEVIGFVDTGVDPNKAACESFLANADGKRGSGSRVLRRFPRVDAWKGTLDVIFWDDTIIESVFVETLTDSGLLIGVGRRRPENKGFFGRFTVEKAVWHDRVDLASIDFAAQ